MGKKMRKTKRSSGPFAAFFKQIEEPTCNEFMNFFKNCNEGSEENPLAQICKHKTVKNIMTQFAPMVQQFNDALQQQCGSTTTTTDMNNNNTEEVVIHCRGQTLSEAEEEE